jgi:general secretion pathway protein D
VSSLGQNLGTPSQPAFSIGSRNAETSMLLRDGETAILGGLIQDNERNSKILVPGIGDIPVVGALLTSYSNSRDRTDVLLTITPRVVRGWELPPVAGRQFYSGSENGYADRQLFAELKTAAVTDAGALVAPSINTTGTATMTASPVHVLQQPEMAAEAAPSAPPQAPSQAQAAMPQLGFSEAVYEMAAGEEFTIKLTGQNLAGVASLPIEVLYNAQVMNLVRGEAGESTPQSFDTGTQDGVLSVNLAYAPDAAPTDASVIANLVMRAGNPGVSYLLYRTKTVVGANGEPINAQTQAARVVVR